MQNFLWALRNNWALMSVNFLNIFCAAMAMKTGQHFPGLYIMTGVSSVLAFGLFAYDWHKGRPKRNPFQ